MRAKKDWNLETGVRSAVVVCALAALALVWVGQAAAASLGAARGLEYIRSAPAKVGEQDDRTAACPDGTEALGGGGAVEGPSGGARLNENYPVLELGSGWVAEGSSRAKKRELRAYAVCTRNIDVTIASDSMGVGLGSDQTTAQNRGCPSLGYPSGGGVSATGAGIETVNNFYLAGGSPGWYTTALNPTMTDTVVQFHTACVPPDRSRFVRESKPVALKPGESGEAIAHCRRGEVAEGGGWRAERGDPGEYRSAAAIATRPWDSADRGRTPEDGWLVKARNVENKRVALVASAGCRAPDR